MPASPAHDAPVILDGLLLFAATCAWTTVLWFYGRAEYREPRWWTLFLLAAAAIGLCLLPFGWIAAAMATYFGLWRLFDFPKPAARLMTVSLLALYFATWLLFFIAGPPAPPL